MAAPVRQLYEVAEYITSVLGYHKGIVL